MCYWINYFKSLKSSWNFVKKIVGLFSFSRLGGQSVCQDLRSSRVRVPPAVTFYYDCVAVVVADRRLHDLKVMGSNPVGLVLSFFLYLYINASFFLFFLKMGHSRTLLLFIFDFSIVQLVDKILPVSGFELRISDVLNDCSTNWATTTAQH